MQWKKQLENITTDMEVKIYLTPIEFSGTKTVTWECHVDVSSKGIYNMI